MRRSDVITFTFSAVRKTHATWLCDHSESFVRDRAPHITRPMALSERFGSARTKSEIKGPLRWPSRSRPLLRCVFPQVQEACSSGRHRPQSPDYNHLSPWEQTSSTLMWRGVGVLFCVHRVRCDVRCGSSSLHRAFANMHFPSVFLAWTFCALFLFM